MLQKILFWFLSLFFEVVYPLSIPNLGENYVVENTIIVAKIWEVVLCDVKRKDPHLFTGNLGKQRQLVLVAFVSKQGNMERFYSSSGWKQKELVIPENEKNKKEEILRFLSFLERNGDNLLFRIF